MDLPIDHIFKEQLGGLMFMLCLRDAEILQLKDENRILKEQLAQQVTAKKPAKE